MDAINLPISSFALNIRNQLLQKQKYSNEFIQHHKDKLNYKYNNLIDKITNQISSTINKIENVMETQITLIQDQITSYLLEFSDIENLLLKSLFHSFSNLEDYLDSVDVNNPTNNPSHYIKKTLLAEDLLKENFNFLKYHLSYDNKLLNDGIKEIITSTLQHNNISYTISSKDDRVKNTTMLMENFNKISALTFSEIDKAHEYFTNKKLIFNKLSSIQFKNSNFNSVAFQNENIIESERFPVLTKLIYFNSFPTEDNHMNALSLPPFTITSRMPNIQILKFEKAKIINSELEVIFRNVILKTNLMKTLQVISFSDNSIKSFNFKELVNDEEYVDQFDQLQEIDFSYNKMSFFKLFYAFFPQIKFINLIENQFSNKIEIEFPSNKNTLLLCNRNLILTNKSTLDEYYQRLQAVLPDYSYKLELMSLSGLYTKFTAQSLIDLNINPVIFLNILMLDLSHCGLNTEILIQFLIKNNKMLKLKTLNLKYNFITLDFFEEYNKIFNETKETRLMCIERIDMSNNSIENNDFKYVLEFIKVHKHFSYINFQMNPFGREYFIEKKSILKEINIPNANDNSNSIHSENDSKTILPFYNVNNNKDKIIGNQISFCDLLLKLYHPDQQVINKTFYLDFSTESKMIKASQLEKKKYMLTIKPKATK